jgi:hypothetical protein
MNYKIGDKVNLAPTTPLIITNILAGSTKIEVKSPDNDICIWTSPDHLTPTLRPESTSIPPHKSPSIGDLIVTKPTAKSKYDSPIGDRLGIIEEDSLIFKNCYIVRWVRHLYTYQTFHDAYSVVHPSQFV